MKYVNYDFRFNLLFYNTLNYETFLKQQVAVRLKFLDFFV